MVVTMPNAWMHATIDLISFGRSYFDLHHEKDRWARTMGPLHRQKDHEWYWQFGREWSFANPFPLHVLERATFGLNLEPEEVQAYVSHDYWDRLWNVLSREQRKYDESFFVWLLLHPVQLGKWAEIDVLKGRICRCIDGKKTWRPCPVLRQEYARLRAYAKCLRAKDPEIRRMLSRFG